MNDKQSSDNRLPTHSKQLRRLAIGLLATVSVLVFLLFFRKTPPPPDEAPTSPIAQQEDTPTAVPEKSTVPASSAQTLIFRSQQFHVFRLQDSGQHLQLFYSDSTGTHYERFERVYEQLTTDGQKVSFLTNGGIFKQDGTPEGLLVVDYETINTLNEADGKGNFYLKPNGVFYQTDDGKYYVQDASELEVLASEMRLGVQSGPLLVGKNHIHPAFNEGSPNLHIRSGVGVTSAGTVVFAISDQEVNFYDFASLFRDTLDCPNALYLDGFISDIYAPSLGKNAFSSNVFSQIFAISTPQ